MASEQSLSKKQLKELRRLEKLQQKNLEQKSDMVKWIVIGGVSVLFLALFFVAIVIGKNRNNPTASNNTANIQFADNGHVRMASGEVTNLASLSAKTNQKMVTMVEYGDLECPACKAYHPLVKQLLSLYPNQLKLIFKEFPLTSVHKNAMVAAVAAESAGRQGKFFQFIDMLYDKQDEWAQLVDPQPKFDEYAKAIGLNLDQFHKDQKDPAITKLIDSEENEGVNNGVNSTPSFFVDGVKIDNPQDIQGFQKIIDAELKKISGNSQPQQVPGKQLPLQ